MTEATTQLQHTSLFAEHEILGASFTDFGGWNMPLKYGSELAEHRAVRETAGLFDLSHMGELRVQGPHAVQFLNTALVGDFANVAIGRAKYSLICSEQGGIIDDLIVYRLAADEFLVVPNAGNAAVVAEAFLERAAGFDVTVADETAATSLIAVQGPASVAIVRSLVVEEEHELVTEMKYYAAAPATVAGTQVLLARTGYTGEDGFELYVANEHAAELWRAVLAAGEPHGLLPAGLASRDSLRLEAGMPLYGNELSLEITPFEAGLGAVVSFTKPEQFVGREALEARRDEGPKFVLVGLTSAGRRAGRPGYTVHPAAATTVGGEADDTTVIGRITSGLPSPTLGRPVALAYVDPASAAVGTHVQVDLRGKLHPFEVAATPFYKRQPADA